MILQAFDHAQVVIISKECYFNCSQRISSVLQYDSDLATVVHA